MHAAPHIPQRPADGLPMPQRLGAILAVAFGVSLSVIDGTVANVALPTIGQQLGISAADSIWIVNAYQLAIMVSLLSLSALGDVVELPQGLHRRADALHGGVGGLFALRVAPGPRAGARHAGVRSRGHHLGQHLADPLHLPQGPAGTRHGRQRHGGRHLVGGRADAGGGHPLRGRLAVAVRRERPDRAGRPGAQPPVPAGESRTGARTPLRLARRSDERPDVPD